MARCLSVVTAIVIIRAAASSPADDSDVVINEIMYNPPQDRDDLQYIELYNPGSSAADLSGWALKGVKFVFPDKTEMAPGAYRVICSDRAAFAEHYGTTIRVLGDFPGRLKHGGEKIELVDADGNTVDGVTYSDEEPWPVGPDGYSPSLERICPSASGSNPYNWAASQMPVMERATGTPGRENDSFSPNLPPAISRVEFKSPAPGQEMPVTADVEDADGVREVTLLYRLARTGGQTSETAIAMERIAGDEKKGTYRAAIEGRPEGSLVRFRIRAADAAGTRRLQPGPNEPRPTYSYSTFINTNTARIPFAHVINVGRLEAEPPEPESAGFSPAPGPGGLADRGAVQPPRPRPPFGPPRGFGGFPNFRSSGAEPARGNGAFIYIPPDGGEVLTFDHVHIRPRNGGYKVHFQRDRAFQGMTGINLLGDQPPRWILSEGLSYELYRMAGVPTPRTGHVRLWEDGRGLGYHFLFEQENKAFLDRVAGDNSGNLYKLLWYGRGVIGQHEKKTNEITGHDDLVQLIEGLNASSGAQQWEYIQKNFAVDQWISLYAVNMCIQNWDGFFNNYFLYHDTGGSGKWLLFPWDLDKTWGDYDGASPQYDWYTMPLTFGMKGDRPPRGGSLFGALGLGPFGGVSWWRPGGYFGEPMLANPEFRARFLARLEEICNTLFTEERFFPIIDALEKRLEPEVPVRAEARGEDVGESVKLFRHHIQTFRDQLKNRRTFLLAELKKTKG